jgi:hypothetical protein
MAYAKTFLVNLEADVQAWLEYASEEKQNEDH